MMDEIAILSVPWPEAQAVMATDAPLTAERPTDPTWTAEATLFPETYLAEAGQRITT